MSQRLFLQFVHSDNSIPVHHELIAGRSRSRCNLYLPDYLNGRTEFISATHFKITRWSNGQHVIMDLKSSNGTWRNGERLTPNESYELHPYDIIQVTGNKKFQIRIILREVAETGDDDVTRESNTSTLIQSRPNFKFGIHFDAAANEFIVDNKPVPEHYLNPQEWDLLFLLHTHQGTVCTYQEIEKVVWGIPVKRNTLIQRVKSLRSKLDKIAPNASNYIQTVRGYGYKYVQITR